MLLSLGGGIERLLLLVGVVCGLLRCGGGADGCGDGGVDRFGRMVLGSVYVLGEI